MHEHQLIGIALIIIIGITASWAAWVLRIPSILFLLAAGLILGPGTGLVNPDELLGDLLFPLVSLSVAIILFEGGLTLRWREIRSVASTVRNLVSVGALIAWGGGTAAAYYLLEFGFALSVLTGAVLVVTGPTVILPILRLVRPAGRINAVLKWEGILNDPIGALLAVLVYESLYASGVNEITVLALEGLAKTLFLGGLLAAGGAAVIVFALKRRLLPESLQNPVTVAVVVGVFGVSNLLQAESGLFTVTLMGILLANQSRVRVHHIIEFKENLRVILLSSLFIILSARLEVTDLAAIDFRAALFLAALILLVRPAAILLSTVRAELNWRERFFLAMMAPRGIVAAAVASLFALELAERGVEGADRLAPIIFFVIVGTILVYGLGALPLARRLRIADADPQGCLIIGADIVARRLGRVLKENDFAVLLTDTNRENITRAHLDGLRAHHGSALAEEAGDELDLTGIGRMLAMTPNREVNALAALNFEKSFGKHSVYQLPFSEEPESRPGPRRLSSELHGRRLFSAHATHEQLIAALRDGAQIHATPITEKYPYSRLLEHHGPENVMPLFVLTPGEDKQLLVVAEDTVIEPKPGQIVIHLDAESISAHEVND